MSNPVKTIKYLLALMLFAYASMAEQEILRRLKSFPQDRVIEATVNPGSGVECLGIGYIQNSVVGFDPKFHRLDSSAKFTFTNHSKQPVLLYKKFSIFNERVALSTADLNSGHLVGGFEATYTGSSEASREVPLDDFVEIAPGKSYSAHHAIPLHVMPGHSVSGPPPGRFWAELGLDARPELFYYSPIEQQKFVQKWNAHDHIVEFVLTKPFSFVLSFDPKLKPCN